MEVTTIFTQLSLVLLVVVAMSVLMRFLRQPLIMGYIITGVLVGPSFTPMGLRMPRRYSTWAPSRPRVRSPIQSMWAPRL